MKYRYIRQTIKIVVARFTISYTLGIFLVINVFSINFVFLLGINTIVYDPLLRLLFLPLTFFTVIIVTVIKLLIVDDTIYTKSGKTYLNKSIYTAIFFKLLIILSSFIFCYYTEDVYLILTISTILGFLGIEWLECYLLYISKPKGYGIFMNDPNTQVNSNIDNPSSTFRNTEQDNLNTPNRLLPNPQESITARNDYNSRYDNSITDRLNHPHVIPSIETDIDYFASPYVDPSIIPTGQLPSYNHSHIKTYMDKYPAAPNFISYANGVQRDSLNFYDVFYNNVCVGSIHHSHLMQYYKHITKQCLEDPRKFYNLTNELISILNETPGIFSRDSEGNLTLRDPSHPSGNVQPVPINRTGRIYRKVNRLRDYTSSLKFSKNLVFELNSTRYEINSRLSGGAYDNRNHYQLSKDMKERVILGVEDSIDRHMRTGAVITEIRRRHPNLVKFE